MSIILIIILVLLLFGGIGAWPSFGLMNHGMGYGPSGLLFVILIVLLVWALSGRSLP